VTQYVKNGLQQQENVCTNYIQAKKHLHHNHIHLLTGNTRSSADADRLHNTPKILYIALEKASNRGINFKDTQGHYNAAIRQAVYEYHFLVVACCCNISI